MGPLSLIVWLCQHRHVTPACSTPNVSVRPCAALSPAATLSSSIASQAASAEGGTARRQHRASIPDLSFHCIHQMQAKRAATRLCSSKPRLHASCSLGAASTGMQCDSSIFRNMSIAGVSVSASYRPVWKRCSMSYSLVSTLRKGKLRIFMSLTRVQAALSIMMSSFTRMLPTMSFLASSRQHLAPGRHNDAKSRRSVADYHWQVIVTTVHHSWPAMMQPRCHRCSTALGAPRGSAQLHAPLTAAAD